ncbi:MAG: protein kinase [Proteobacteria bacterium]|nr:protein kinase [Pseudomonadota bacterium]
MPGVTAIGASTIRTPSSGSDDTAVATSSGARRVGDPERTLAIVDRTRYVSVRELARGGMGRISVAEDRALGRTVAIKELLVDAPDLEARFHRELTLTSRLQHPGIVSIHDGGVWPTGEPVYIMRLVSGESLEVRIARCLTVDDRIALVPHAIAAVDALAYAHSQGVIHRDLKPANIMVGDFGETVVIDWGLAKDLRAASADPTSPPSVPSSSALDTVAGDVIGTPAYMPPEQARGADVDERADVYALGAVLYHVLAGVPPYRGRAVEVLAAVIDGPPPSLGEQAPGIPADLLAIVARAMATEPADRYASAAELGAELKRFQNGQLVAAHHYTPWELVRRWIARRRTTVAVALIAVVVLVGGAVVSVRRIVREEQRVRTALELAEHHHVEAERRGAEAERLIDFMLFQLYAKLQPIGRLDLLGDVAQTMKGHYDGRTDAHSPDELRKRARARRNLGDVLSSKGDSSAALREYQAVIALVEGAPGDPALQVELVETEIALGKVQEAQGQTAAAIATYQQARAIVARNVSGTSDPTWRRQGVLVDVAIGEIQRAQGQLSAAVATLRTALAAAVELGASDDGHTAQDLLTRCHDELGDTLIAQGEFAGALVEYRAALALDTARVARSPDDATLQAGLMMGYLKVGDLLARRDDVYGALAMYRSSQEVVLTLTLHDPENTIWLRELSVSHTRIGDALAQPTTATAALASYQAAKAIRLRLTAKDPSNSDWQRDLMVSYTKVATMLEATDQLAPALQEYEVARAIAEKLVAKDPNTARSQQDLVFVYSGLGRVRELQHDGAGALRWFRAALSSAEQTLGQRPGDVVSKDVWAVILAHESIGDVLASQGDRDAAAAAYAQAATIADRRAGEEPTDPSWKDKAVELRAVQQRSCATRRK